MSDPNNFLPGASTPTSILGATALNRVAKFCTMWRRLHPRSDGIYGLNSGEPSAAELLVADLEQVLAHATDTLESRARLFATAAHGAKDQRRRYTEEPYIFHPAEVVALVKTVPHTPEMVAAAWLHDVVEDTKVGWDTVRQEFGPVVASYVRDLTDISQKSDGDRPTRRAIDRTHTAGASPEAKTIKLADLIDNTRNIVALDPDFARIYLHEKRLLLDVLKEGDPTLWARAAEQCDYWAHKCPVMGAE